MSLAGGVLEGSVPSKMSPATELTHRTDHQACERKLRAPCPMVGVAQASWLAAQESGGHWDAAGEVGVFQGPRLLPAALGEAVIQAAAVLLPSHYGLCGIKGRG